MERGGADDEARPRPPVPVAVARAVTSAELVPVGQPQESQVVLEGMAVAVAGSAPADEEARRMRSVFELWSRCWREREPKCVETHVNPVMMMISG